MQSVDNPVVVNDKFANVLVVKFRYFAAHSRKARQNPRLIHNVPENDAGVGGGIGSYVVGDGIEILGGALTRLFGEPFAETTLNFFLRKNPIDARIFQSSTHLVENVEMVLNVFDRDVIRQSVQ